MHNRYKKGFTLVELLVTIAIIGLLSTIGTVAFVQARKKANSTKVTADLATIRKAIDILANDTEQWPGHQLVYNVCQSDVSGIPGCDVSNNEICDDGCEDFNNNPAPFSSGFAGLLQDDVGPGGTPYDGWDGPYLHSTLLDPWGNEYFFDTDYDVGGGNFHAVVGSYGPNGQGLNAYDSDDIVLILVE